MLKRRWRGWGGCGGEGGDVGSEDAGSGRGRGRVWIQGRRSLCLELLLRDVHGEATSVLVYARSVCVCVRVCECLYVYLCVRRVGDVDSACVVSVVCGG